MPQSSEILSFWFDRQPGESGAGKSRKVWFAKDPQFDREIQTRFRVAYDRAAAGTLDHWQATAEGCLGLILLLDQFPRHLFRGQPQAFATDAKALAIAQHTIAQTFDQALPVVQRLFIYLPFEHSENLEHQRQSVKLLDPLRNEPDTHDAYAYALKHLEVIQRFGRFPHRNRILSRTSTPAEIEFLKQPGSSF